MSTVKDTAIILDSFVLDDKHICVIKGDTSNMEVDIEIVDINTQTYVIPGGSRLLRQLVGLVGSIFAEKEEAEDKSSSNSFDHELFTNGQEDEASTPGSLDEVDDVPYEEPKAPENLLDRFVVDEYRTKSHPQAISARSSSVLRITGPMGPIVRLLWLVRESDYENAAYTNEQIARFLLDLPREEEVTKSVTSMFAAYLIILRRYGVVVKDGDGWRLNAGVRLVMPRGETAIEDNSVDIHVVVHGALIAWGPLHGDRERVAHAVLTNERLGKGAYEISVPGLTEAEVRSAINRLVIEGWTDTSFDPEIAYARVVEAVAY